MILRFEHNGKPVTVQPGLGEWHIYIGDQRVGRFTMDASRPQEYILATQDHFEIGREIVHGSPSEEQLRRCGCQIADASSIDAGGRPETIFHYEDDPPARVVFVDRGVPVDAEPVQTDVDRPSTTPPPLRRSGQKKTSKEPARPMPMQVEPTREFSEDLWDCDHDGIVYRLLTNYDPKAEQSKRYVEFAQQHHEECWMRDVAYNMDGNVIAGWRSIYVRKDSSLSIEDVFQSK